MATVLVVDDDEAIVAIVATIIAESGHTVLTAYNGADALTLARKHAPALVISDVMMPVMDGYALLKALRADPALAHTAVYLMSAAAFASEDDPASAPNGHLHKPFDLSAIDALMEALS